MRIGMAILAMACALLCAPASAQQGTVTIPSVGPGGVARLDAATELRRTCFLAEVAAFDNRVHVKCAVASGGSPLGSLQTRPAPAPPEASIPFFAVGAVADPALASRVVELGVAASAQNRQVQILFRTNPAENPPGCLPSDCRRLVGLILLVQ